MGFPKGFGNRIVIVKVLRKRKDEETKVGSDDIDLGEEVMGTGNGASGSSDFTQGGGPDSRVVAGKINDSKEEEKR